MSDSLGKRSATALSFALSFHSPDPCFVVWCLFGAPPIPLPLRETAKLHRCNKQRTCQSLRWLAAHGEQEILLSVYFISGGVLSIVQLLKYRSHVEKHKRSLSMFESWSIMIHQHHQPATANSQDDLLGCEVRWNTREASPSQLPFLLELVQKLFWLEPNGVTRSYPHKIKTSLPCLLEWSSKNGWRRAFVAGGCWKTFWSLASASHSEPLLRIRPKTCHGSIEPFLAVHWAKPCGRETKTNQVTNHQPVLLFLSFSDWLRLNLLY